MPEIPVQIQTVMTRSSDSKPRQLEENSWQKKDGVSWEDLSGQEVVTSSVLHSSTHSFVSGYPTAQ